MNHVEARPGQQPITVVLVDDHTMMREGTRRLLEEDPDIKVIGEARLLAQERARQRNSPGGA